MKKKITRTTLVLTLFVLFSAFALCCMQTAAFASDDNYSLKLVLAHGATEETVPHRSAVRFKELIEERTGGKITVQIYPNWQLGNMGELVEGVQAGDISMLVVPPGSNVSPALSILDIPNAFPNHEAMVKTFRGGKFRTLLDAEFNKVNTQLLSITPYAFRVMSSNVPVRNANEFKGVKIRTLENPMHLTYWRALGAQPTPLAWSELYVALQQGLVDAQENPLDTIYSTKLYEQQKYAVLTNHIMYFIVFWMNRDVYEGIPEAYKKTLHEAIAETSDYTLKISDESEKESRRLLQEKGMEIIELTPEDHAIMREKAQPVYDMIRKECGDALMDALLEDLKGNE